MFIGLSKIIEEIDLNSQATPFPHILFTGPRGSGKTTLSNYIAKQTKCRCTSVNAPPLDYQKLQSILLTLTKNTILFIDEIHRLHPKVEELLYHPMESRELLLSGMNIKMPPFTLIGATTRPDLITRPLVSRFKIIIQVPRYTVRQLAQMVKAQYPTFSRRDCIQIAQAASVPREALNLGYRISMLQRDVPTALKFLNYRDGLSKLERDYMNYVKYESKSVGTLSALLLVPEPSVEDIEERLIHLGLVEIGSRGRKLTTKGLVAIREVVNE